MYCLFQYRQYFSTSVQIEINPFAFSLFILNLIFPKFSDIITYFMFSCWLVSYTMGIAGLPAYFLLNIFYRKYAYNLFKLECNNFNGKLNIYLKLELLSFLFSIHFSSLILLFLHLFWNLTYFLLFYFDYFSLSSIPPLLILPSIFFQLHFSSYLSSLAPLQVPISSFLVDISSIFISSLFALV